MDNKKVTRIAVTVLALLLIPLLAGTANSADITLKIGMSNTLTGPAAIWGMSQKWGAEEACRRINEAGGITIRGQTYKFKIVAYDMKYTTAEGTKVAKKLVYADKVKYSISNGTAAAMSAQAITEKEKVIHFFTAWTPKTYGPKFPYSFSCFHSFPSALMVYGEFLKMFPQIKKVIYCGPNDESGWSQVKQSMEVAQKRGLEILGTEYYERATTEMYPVVTKLLRGKPDLIDLDGTPPGSGAVILKALRDMKYEGLKWWMALIGWEGALEAAGKEAIEGVYGSESPDFKGPMATPVQRELSEKCEKDLGFPLNVFGTSGWDAIQALVEAMKQANSIDSTDVKNTLPNIIFNSSSGPSAIGGADWFGLPQEILTPVSISQIRGGKSKEVKRIIHEELKEKLSSKGIDWKKYYKE